ncbi:MAG: DUF1353 domain-containing protein [Actinomycetes bacterium]
MDLRQVDQKHFQLMKPFHYVEPGTSYRITIPKHDMDRDWRNGNSTDLASVPTVLRGLVASYGLHTRAALMHDYLCEQGKIVPGSWWNGFRMRRQADELFRVALQESAVPGIRRWLMWAAVSFGRYLSHAWALGVLMLLQMLVSVAAVGVVVFGMADDSWWLVLLGPCVASILWWRDVRVVAIGCVAAPVLVPLVAIGMATAFAVACPWTYWFRSGWRFIRRRVLHLPPSSAAAN